MHIRRARVEDLNTLVALCKAALAETPYAALPVDEALGRKVLLRAISAPTQFCEVLEVDSAVVGVLIGCVDDIWWSTKKQASDLVFYVQPAHRGRGGVLARRFIGWARAQKGVALVGMSVSSGVNIKRVGKLLERLGLEHVGGMYLETSLCPTR